MEEAVIYPNARRKTSNKDLPSETESVYAQYDSILRDTKGNFHCPHFLSYLHKRDNCTSHFFFFFFKCPGLLSKSIIGTE